MVLYLGGLSKDVENALFGLNLIMILVLQERDSVKGEIKYSVIPLALNNAYLFITNLRSLAINKHDSVPSSPSSDKASETQVTNKAKVAYGMFWYIGSLVGYGLMESYQQGLHLTNSR